jgi:predicted DNA-binding transcriptional regulator YafY
MIIAHSPFGSANDEEIKRTSRILEMVLMIASAPERFSRKMLADRFEISERMVTKDLTVIRHGLKLDLCHSSQGYYFSKPPAIPALRFTFPEALSLLNAVQAAQQFSGVASGDLAAAIARLEALFPAEFTPLLRQINTPASVTAQGQHRHQMLMLLNRALLLRRKVEITYETASRGGDVTQRTVRPYAVMPYDRSWQMIAYCEFRQAVVMFKLDRIHQATVLTSGYEIPTTFDLNEYMGNTWGALRVPGGVAEDICLHFDTEAGRWVAEERWHASQEVERLPDGSLIFRVRTVVTDEFVKWVLRYGSQVVVLAPESLREAVRAEHLRAAALYASDGKE